jgi:YbbR domain-containing protein
MKDFLTKNISLKIIALGIAVITWIYVNGEILK